MSIDIYRSVDGLGTRCTGQLVSCIAPLVEYDDIHGIRVDAILSYYALEVQCRIDYDSETQEAILTSITSNGSQFPGPSTVLPLNTPTQITSTVNTIVYYFLNNAIFPFHLYIAFFNQLLSYMIIRITF